MSFSQLPWTPMYTQSGSPDIEALKSSLLGIYALAGTVAFTVCVYLFESSLDARQKRSYQKTTFPIELEKTVARIDAVEGGYKKKKINKEKTKDGDNNDNDDEGKDKDNLDRTKPLLGQLKGKFASAQSYGLDKINFGMISSTYGVFESVIFLMTGFLPYMWDQAAAISQSSFGWTVSNNEIKISLIFLLLITLVGTVTSLPFELYSTFQIEKKHGFNKQTVGLFVTDKIKSLVLTMVIGGPFIALLLRIIQWGGEYFYIYVWGFMFCFSVFMMTVVPIVIMPLFNKYEPLPDGSLKSSIEELAASIKYPLKKLFVMDGSKRSSHSNAFMFGFGSNKRIGKLSFLLCNLCCCCCICFILLSAARDLPFI
jgi:STE24 endopeptidase